MMIDLHACGSFVMALVVVAGAASLGIKIQIL